MPADNIAHLPTDPLTTDQRVRVLEVHHRVLAEQMAEISVAMHDIKSCLQRGDGRMGGLEAELSKNSTTTTEVREILDTARAGLKGAFDAAKGASGSVAAGLKAIGPSLLAGVAGSGAAHLARNIGNPGTAEGPGQAVSDTVAQIPTGGYSPAPAKQAYNAFTDTEAGRNIGNLVSAASGIPGVGPAGRAAQLGFTALQAAAPTIRDDRKPQPAAAPTLKVAGDATMPGQDPNARPPAAQPQAAQPQVQAPSLSDGQRGMEMDLRMIAESQAARLAQNPEPQAPQTRHSGNDWGIRKQLDNMGTSAGSIMGSRKERMQRQAAYQAAVNADLNVQSGVDPTTQAGIKAASEAYTSRNSLRSYADTAAKHLQGAQVPLQVEGMKQQTLRAQQGMMRQIIAAHTGKDGQVDTVGASNAAMRAGMPSIAEELAKSAQTTQGLAAKGQEMGRAQADHFRKTFFSGKFNHLATDKDGNVDAKRSDPLEQEAATMALGMYPNLASMPDAQRNAAVNEVMGVVGLTKKLGRVERGGNFGWMPDALTGQQQFARTDTMRGADFFRGADMGSPYSGLEGALSLDYEKGDHVMKLGGGKGYAHLPQLTEHEKAALEKQIEAANAKTPSIRAK